jgi:hypothetical protein
MIPTECKMPDLSDLTAVKLQSFSMLQVMVGDPGLEKKERSYRRIYGRLVDKAVYEYMMARQSILAQLDEQKRPVEQMANNGRVLFILKFTDFFENCINAINRALSLFEHIKSEAISSGIPRQTRRGLEAYSGSVPGVRNMFEHMDKEISGDNVRDGKPIMLWIGGDGDRAEIGELEIEFTDVARTLRKLHEIGTLLFKTKTSSGPAGNPPADEKTIVLSGQATIKLPRVGASDA